MNIENPKKIEWVMNVFEHRVQYFFNRKRFCPYIVLETAELVLTPHKDGTDEKVLLDETWGKKKLEDVTHEDVIGLLCKARQYYHGNMACQAPIYIRNLYGKKE